MRKFSVWSGAALLAFVLIVTALSLLKPGPLKRDTPRLLPWTLPDHKLAKRQVLYPSNGMIEVVVEHALLKGVTPEMVQWFYRVLPVSTMEYQQVTHPLYHYFHPTEHGTIWIAEPATDGIPGMGAGATIARDEWFGPYDSRGSARIDIFAVNNMVAIAEFGGLRFAKITHSFSAASGGTRYRLQAEIGSDLPVIGPLLNLYLRKRIYHPAMIEEWLRHQVEEVSSLQFFLPQIYAQKNPEHHYVLEFE